MSTQSLPHPPGAGLAAPLFLAAVAVTTLAATAAGLPLTVAEVERAPYAPQVAVVDTVSALGRRATHPRTVTLADLVRYHGHPCDGLVVAAAGIVHGLHHLFPGGVVDRTDLVVAVNRSACYGDAAAYLTGARHRYGSLVVDPKLGDTWILGRRSTGAAVRVALRPGVRPPALPAQERALRGGGCDPGEIAAVQGLQRRFALAVVNRPPAELFTIEPLPRFPYPLGEPRPDTAKAGCPPPPTPPSTMKVRPPS